MEESISGKIQYASGFKIKTLPDDPVSSRPRRTRAPQLTEGLHQISLHVVGHQRVRQLWEEGLHGSGYCVHGEVLLHKVQVVVWEKKKKSLNPTSLLHPYMNRQERWR